MKDRTKNILIGVLIIGLVSMTVAYAALSQTLVINGSARIQAKATTWNVHFTNENGAHEPIEKTAYASIEKENDVEKELDIEATQVEAPEVILKAPGDKVDFYFDVINEGEINAILSALPTNAKNDYATSGELTGYTVAYTDNYAETSTTGDLGRLAALTGDIKVTLTYADGTKIAVNDELKGTLSTVANPVTRRALKLTVEYVNNTSAVQNLPEHEVAITGITSSLTYVQDNAD